MLIQSRRRSVLCLKTFAYTVSYKTLCISRFSHFYCLLLIDTLMLFIFVDVGLVAISCKSYLSGRTKL